jgi:hypothetical protein
VSKNALECAGANWGAAADRGVRYYAPQAYVKILAFCREQSVVQIPAMRNDGLGERALEIAGGMDWTGVQKSGQIAPSKVIAKTGRDTVRVKLTILLDSV